MNVKNKKVIYTIIGIVAVLLVAIAITYAYWLITKNQTGENVISSACLDISLTEEENDITLTNQFPLSDADGMALTPYTFTVTNNCNTSVDYQIALETFEGADTISSSAIKIMIDSDTPMILNESEKLETRIDNATNAYLLKYGTLSAKDTEGSSATHSLRIWIDENAPISEMKKTLTSKISVTIGQGIFNPYKEGTLAYSILANYGGAGAIQSLSTEWTEGEYKTATYHLSMTKTTSYYWGTEMNFDKTTAEYTLGGTIVQATTTECRNGQKSDGTAITCSYTLRSSSDAAYANSYGYKVTALTSSTETDTSSTLYITVQQTGTASNSFSKVTEDGEYGLYTAQDDYGTSYYFRGDVENNYVQFGEYATETTLNVYDYNTFNIYDYNTWSSKTVTVPAGTPMYWRIVRINGDGTIRLIYDGTSAVANGTRHTATIAATAYNTNYNDAKYVGYTYDNSGTQTDSTIKGVIDTWYDEHLETTYGSYIADSIFCNDREVTRSNENGNVYYAPYSRLERNKTPTLTCTNKADRYTVSDTTNGNGLLTNPVGLITADEAFFAGGNSSNRSYYLYSGEMYWTSAPYPFEGDYARVWLVNDDGSVYSNFYGVSLSYPGARPVINLKADVLFVGSGTTTDPYVIGE